jgi:hypothetical protein
MIDPVTMATLVTLGSEILKIWIPAGALLFGIFRGWLWVKNKFVNIDANVIEMKKSLDTHFDALRSDVQDQTKTIAGALSEQRQDFRTFYAPMFLMQQSQVQQAAAPVRAKKAPRKPARKK